MMKITGLSHLFKWENLHNWWLTKHFFAPLYVLYVQRLDRQVCAVAWNDIINMGGSIVVVRGRVAGAVLQLD
jgi:hypothetical protein